MKIRKVSLIVFYDKKNKILLQDRRNMSKRGEQWGFFGGEIEKGETSKKALIRETKEELDFNLKKSRLVGIVEGNISPEFKVIANVFIAPIDDNLKRFNQKEGRAMGFFSIDSAKKLKMAPSIDRKILDCLEVYFRK